MIFLSRFGDGYVYAFIGFILLIVDRSTFHKILPVAALAYPLELTIQKISKKVLKRRRPCNSIPEVRNLISPPDEFSFPSGHAASAFVAATILSRFYPPLSIPSYLLASLISLSRIYNGVHYPGDVLAGAFLGFACVKFAILLLL
jgi:undecaprenyl-diphosphatase